jgi:hypothetical protein
MWTLLLGALVPALAGESYSVDRLDPPPGVILEVGGMDWLDDGQLVVSTRRGQVWIVEHALDPDPAAARFKLFAEGLQEGLGLKVVNDQIYVLQRSELSRLTDLDGDGTCDRIETISNDFGVSGNYHEFAFGLPTDAAGNFYVSLNVGFTEPKWWHGRSLAPWRGWVMKIAPDGTTTPLASGFRSPCGIGTNAAGDLFVTDNQGDWMPVCPLEHVKQGGFYGAPASLVWTDAYKNTNTEPSLTNPVDVPRTPPACWIPYKWSRSTGDMRPAPRDGSFGPFSDQLILAELTNGLVLRADLEKVRGEYQGAVMLLREDVGSAVRTLFARDGTLMLGLTNRGWGGRAPGHGIARVRWNKTTPFEIEHVRLRQDGFALEFTEPLAEAKLTPANIDVSLYHYDWWWEYGSPERNDGTRAVSAIEVASDRRSLVVHAPIEAGHMARVILKDVVSASGRALEHAEFAYTINQLPEGPLCTTPIARVVPPPPARATKDEGWLRLTYGDALDVWSGREGFELVDADLDAKDPKRFAISKGNGALVNTSDKVQRLSSTPVFGDGQYKASVMLASGAAAVVYVGGCFGIRLSDDSALQSGAIVGPENEADLAPKTDFRVVPGTWHQLVIDFRAPRCAPDGTVVESARFAEVRIDGVLVQYAVELAAPSRGASTKPAASGPLVLVATPSNVAFSDVRAKPVLPARDGAWKPLMGDDDFGDWSSEKGGTWKREDGVLSDDRGLGRIFSGRLDLENVRVHARVKIGSGGLAWLLVHAAGARGSGGIAIALNADHPSASRTGSVSVPSNPVEQPALPWKDFAPRRVSLVGADTWFDLEVEVREEDAGESVRVEVRVNGALVNAAVVPRADGMGGSLGFENHHQGSVLEVSTLEIQDLSASANDRAPLPPK